MKIRTKLLLNTFLILLAVFALIFFGFLALKEISNNISHLTQRSTPYQVKTMAYQRALQAVVGDLIRVSVAKDEQEFQNDRNDAEKSFESLKNTQESLERLTPDIKLTSYEELKKVAQEVYQTTDLRIKTEKEALSARNQIVQRLQEVNKKLKDFDTKIKSLQLNRAALMTSTIEETKTISSTLKSYETLRLLLKDLTLILHEVPQAKDQRILLIQRGKINTLINNAINLDVVKASKGLTSELKSIGKNAQDLINLQMALLKQLLPEQKQKADALSREISEKISALFLRIEQESNNINLRFKESSEKQELVLTEANIANNILFLNSELNSLGLTLNSLVNSAFTVNTPKDVEAIAGEVQKTLAKIDSVYQSLEKQLNKIKAKEELKILAVTKTTFTSVKATLFGENGIFSKLRRQIEMKEKVKKVQALLEEILAKEVQKAKERVTSAQEEQERTVVRTNQVVKSVTTFFFLIGGVIAGVTLILGFWIYLSISNPLKALLKEADLLSQGYLTTTIKKRRKDEVGLVLSSMNKVVENLQDIVTRLKGFVKTITDNSRELLNVAHSLSKGSEEQMLQIEQAVANLTEISIATQDIAENSGSTASSAQKMQRITQEGKEMMYNTRQELQRFVEVINQTSQRIESLAQKSEAINDIIKLIKNITEQTNLLALNAGIEAARAGVHGKGFAVVAENIRFLARKTGSAADEITQNVQTMLDAIQEAVEEMQNQQEIAQLMVNHLEKTIQAIEEMASHVDQVTDMISRIASSTHQQSMVIDQASRFMHSISQVTKNLNDQVVKIKKASDDFKGMVEELNKLIDWFKL